MSSAEALREFINRRLAAAAVEIFTVFQQTIVQYEEEIDRQQKLFEITWKPQIKLQRAELPQQHDCREKQLFEQKTKDCPGESHLEPQHVKEEPEEPGLPDFNKEQEEAEPPQVKEREEGEPLKLKFDGDTFRIPSFEDKTYLSQPEEAPDIQHFLSRVSDVHHVKTPVDLESAVTADLEGIVIFERDNMDNVPLSQKYSFCEETSGGETQKLHDTLRCVTEKKTCCDVCGRGFSQRRHLLVHMRSHTGQKPHSCQTCGKRFARRSHLIQHIRTHTGEKPYSCHRCGKSFSQQSSVLRHMKTHTGPHPCEVCGTSFGTHGALFSHMTTHSELFFSAPPENSAGDEITSDPMEDLLQEV